MNNLRNSDRLVRVARSALTALCTAASLALPVPALADDLGRLFFTPQERQELDRRRASNIVDREAPAVESLVTVNGQVTRSGGKTTTWINGVAHDDTYRGRDPARVGVQGRSVKVGETLDRSRGAVTDPLQGGEIRIQGAPAR
ncbi:MAG: hypothetical protein ACREVP_06425 [Burkholderiales bacterium]